MARVDYLKLAEKAEAEYWAKKEKAHGPVPEVPKANHNPSSGTFGTPYPKNEFMCDLCGAHFDTASGIDRHRVWGCEHTFNPEPQRTLPSCSRCGSYALHREKSGAVTCETCRRSK